MMRIAILTVALVATVSSASGHNRAVETRLRVGTDYAVEPDSPRALESQRWLAEHVHSIEWPTAWPPLQESNP